MALIFPLAPVSFMDRLPVQEMPPLICEPRRQITGLGGGEILSAEISPALWEGSVSLAPMPARFAEEITGLLSALGAPGASFMAYRKNMIGPAGDPQGVTLGAAAVSLTAPDLVANTLRLQGLPSGYNVAAGDLMAFTYGTSPTRYALHRALTPGTASAGGLTGVISVVPYLRPGVVAGASVVLVNPTFKAVLVPGSVDYGSTRNGVTSGVGFSFRQTLR